MKQHRLRVVLRFAVFAILIAVSHQSGFAQRLGRGTLTEERRDYLREQISRFRAAHRLDSARTDSLARLSNTPRQYSARNGQTYWLWAFDAAGRPIYYSTHDVYAAITLSSNRVWSGGGYGFSLSGSDITLGLWDVGKPRFDHQEYSQGGVSRVLDQDGLEAGYATPANHFTMMAGLMIGSGAQSGFSGMAPQARIDAYELTADYAEMPAAALSGMKVSSHSYGDALGWEVGIVGSTQMPIWTGDLTISASEDHRFGLYTTQSQTWDQVAFDNEYYLIVKSAGNERTNGFTGVQHGHLGAPNVIATDQANTHQTDGGTTGFDCIGNLAVGKNILTVGGINSIAGGYSQTSDVVAYSKGSWGPTDDGRIKPDLAAPADYAYSPANGLYGPFAGSTTSYGYWDGTSQATATVAGSLGLLLEHEEDLYGTAVYRASTLKAVVLHTTDEAGAYAGPDYKFGWGLMNTLRAAQVMSDHAVCGAVIGEFEIRDGETLEIPISADGSEPIRATMCWTDPPGTPPTPSLNPTTRMLVNDIDLRIASGSTSHKPWVLDPAPGNRSNPATLDDNIIDNVEQVHVTQPASGEYVVRISHKGSLQPSGTQIVSLVVTGATTPTNMTLSNTTFSTNVRRVYRASNTITAGNAFVVDNLAALTLVAGSEIILTNGFAVENGGELHAYIEPCAGVITEKLVLREMSASMPTRSALLGATPNPFSSHTDVEVEVVQAGHVSLTLHDNLGRMVRRVVDEAAHPAGRCSYRVDSQDLPSGSYTCVVVVGDRSESIRLVILR